MRQPGIAGTVVTPGAQRSPKIIVGSLAGTDSYSCIHARIVLAKTTVFLYSVCVQCAVRYFVVNFTVINGLHLYLRRRSS
jgi:hypothetical protein